ncbi:hypothetical protein [Xanthobacter tagetidis]|jgi:hypothetical protein|uniref:Uncharacterized protein n=1 Tax=Xanthobacter tagetidis TaxID=60216 RepID=A0A3L7A671_9HYPH|nr:hypothetical protein [Xanthobacter tagetidis]MBB6307251.1 hypothetical protein [Xanthobacter tagetidis]RLP75799.1 hypothetical protein D9R14_16020 [Xanthobacter tagetidis]
MSTVVLFSAAKRKREAAPISEPAPLAGPKVVILPVVRIERHAEPEMALARVRGQGPGLDRKVH